MKLEQLGARIINYNAPGEYEIKLDALSLDEKQPVTDIRIDHENKVVWILGDRHR